MDKDLENGASSFLAVRFRQINIAFYKGLNSHERIIAQFSRP